MTDGVGRLKHTSFRHQTLHLVASNYVALLQRLDGEVLACQLVLGQQYLQITVAMLHSNGQLRTQRYGDTEKGVKNLLYSIRLLMMMMMTNLPRNSNPKMAERKKNDLCSKNSAYRTGVTIRRLMREV